MGRVAKLAALGVAAVRVLRTGEVSPRRAGRRGRRSMLSRMIPDLEQLGRTRSRTTRRIRKAARRTMSRARRAVRRGVKARREARKAGAS